jgi:hypothetical protein
MKENSQNSHFDLKSASGRYNFRARKRLLFTTFTFFCVLFFLCVSVVDFSFAGIKSLGGPGLAPAPVNLSTGGQTLTVSQVSYNALSNVGMGPNNINNTLPLEGPSLAFWATIGESQAASYWRLTATTAGSICLNGTCGKNYVSEAAPTEGDLLFCATMQMTGTGLVNSAALAIGSTATNVASGAFSYAIAPTTYAKTAVAAGTALASGTIPQSKWGIYLFSINAAGTITVTAGAGNSTGYATEALAIAALPSTPASSASMGYVTVINTSTGGFVAGTTTLSAAGVTAHYYNSALYTPAYGWDCNSLRGTWTTN